MPDETPNPDEMPKTTETPPSDPPKASDTNPDTGKRYTQDEFEAEVKRRLASQKAAIESAQEKERKKAEDAALAQQGEYQKLAEERQQRITELEQQIGQIDPLNQQLTRAKAALGSILAKEREGLPAHILTLLDGKDEADQLEYIAANRDALKPATDQRNGAHIPGSPKPADPAQLSEQQRKEGQQSYASTLKRRA